MKKQKYKKIITKKKKSITSIKFYKNLEKLQNLIKTNKFF